MCVGNIRNNSLVGGRIQAKALSVSRLTAHGARVLLPLGTLTCGAEHK